MSTPKPWSKVDKKEIGVEFAAAPQTRAGCPADKGCDLVLRPAAHGCASAAEAMDGRERPP
jgi:hypothetical protein